VKPANRCTRTSAARERTRVSATRRIWWCPPVETLRPVRYKTVIEDDHHKEDQSLGLYIPSELVANCMGNSRWSWLEGAGHDFLPQTMQVWDLFFTQPSCCITN